MRFLVENTSLMRLYGVIQALDPQECDNSVVNMIIYFGMVRVIAGFLIAMILGWNLKYIPVDLMGK